MPRKKEDSEVYKDILQSIADHGAEVVEVINPSYASTSIFHKERILIVLEMLYQQAAEGGSLGAAQQYLDRLLGRAKESLTLTNGSDLISKLSDEELTDKVTRIIAATGEGAAGGTD